MEEKMLAARDYALIDLHLHLDGSLSLASVRQLAAMEQLALPESDREDKIQKDNNIIFFYFISYKNF